MRPFRRQLGRYTASFTTAEVSLLADLVDQVRGLLAQRRPGPSDPLAELTGIVSGNSERPGDPALLRLLPDFHAEDAELSAGLRLLREPELLTHKDSAAVKLLDTLPRGGGTVHLDESAAGSWIAAINDVRLALGVRLDITDDAEGSAIPPEFDEDDPRAYAYQAYGWLAYLQDSLVAAMMD